MNGRTNPNRPTHLTDDQLDGLLLGESAPAVAAHLAACTLCQARNQAFTATLGHFNQATLDWAEASGMRAAHRAPATRPSTGLRFFPAYAWAFAAAILLVAAMLFPRTARVPVETSRAPQPTAATQPVAQPDPQIAADNSMMTDIDTALNQPDPLPLALNLDATGESAPYAPGESASRR